MKLNLRNIFYLIYLTSEHLAVWYKTGIAESHELESIRDFWERMIVY